MQIGAQELIGRRVVGPDGKSVGRIEEIAAEERDGRLFITEYHVGSFALFERITSASIIRGVFHTLGMGRGDGLAVPWDKLDLSEPAQPKLTCDASSLSPPRQDQT